MVHGVVRTGISEIRTFQRVVKVVGRKICFGKKRANYFDSNFKASEALFQNIGSQPHLHIRITQEAVANPEAQTVLQNNYIRISGGGIQGSDSFKIPSYDSNVQQG